MTIAYVNAGTLGVGTTSVTPGTPASLANSNGVFVVVVTKPNTASIGTPTNWQLVGSNSGGAGVNGASTGPTRVGVFFREKDASWSSVPAITVTSGNSTAAMAFQFSKTGGGWDHFNRNGTYNGATAGTAFNVITAATEIAAGDWILTALSNGANAPSWSGQSYTSTGITYAAVTEFADNIQTGTGNDVGGAFWGAQVTAGAGTVTIQQQATASGASTGAVVCIRVREVARPQYIRSSNPAVVRASTR